MVTKSKKVKFENLEQVIQRLNRTVIMFNGSPHYVYNIQEATAVEDITLGIVKLPIFLREYNGRDLNYYKISDERFGNFYPINVGFCNIFEKSLETGRQTRYPIIVRRIPVRRTLHGLGSANTKVTGLLTNDLGLTFNDVVASEGFVEACANKYPSFREACEFLVEDSGIAVSPHFVVSLDKKGYPMFFKNQEAVGIWTSTNKISLLKKYSFLREEILQEENLPNVVEII